MVIFNKLKSAVRIFFLLTALTSNGSWGVYYVFSGKNHDEFIGCLDCEHYSQSSVCNKFGPFGNEFSPTSMFNSRSEYGNILSVKSPWQNIGFEPRSGTPVLVDDKGNYFGYWTIDINIPGAFINASALAENYKDANGNLLLMRDMLCNQGVYTK